jgi:16S rRNA (cytosine1402-N4)-methyltransferase
MTAQHVPVLLTRVVELIGVGVEAAREAGLTPVVVDGTLGMGGHAEAVLTAFDDVHLVGIDRDLQAIDIATETPGPLR